MPNKTSPIRNIINLNGSSAVIIPKDFGFNKDDYVLVEKIDNNSCKITKVEWSKVQQNIE